MSGCKDAFFQVVENHDLSRAAQSAEGLFMEFGPDANTRLETKKSNALTAETERQHEQTRAPVLAGLRVADHGSSAVINLRLFPGCGLDDDRALPAVAFRAVCGHSA